MLSMPGLITTQIQSQYIDTISADTPNTVVASEIFYLKSASDRVW